MTTSMGSAPCVGCGHAPKTHIDGAGLCLAKTCFCLIYRPEVARATT